MLQNKMQRRWFRQSAGNRPLFRTGTNVKNSMKKQYDVVTIGDLCVDCMMWGSDVTPEFNQEEKILDDYSLEMGGSCTIFACQCAKLSLSTSVVGTMGTDLLGDLVEKRLLESGVDVSNLIRSSDRRTGYSLALVRGNTRAVLSCLGSMDDISFADVPESFLTGARHWHIGSYYLLNRIRPDIPKIVRIAKANGATVSVDTNFDPKRRWTPGLTDLLPETDIFLPNETELCAIMKEQNVETALRKAARIVPLCVVKRGPRGAMACRGDEVYRWEAIQTDLADTVGAGDTFDAGYLFGFLRGLPVEQCGRIASVCAAGNIAMSGGIAGQPLLSQMLSRYGEVYGEALTIRI